MNDTVIRVENLSKQYRIGAKLDGYKTLRETLTDGFVAPFRRTMKLLRGQASSAAEMDEKIWALKDVSFEIKRGEVVGIIGCNGAGKTTLLKILSRITEPTEGQAEIHGRVGSLLEVGTGFHPELTGRENIYLNGAILGMKKTEIQHKFDDMVAFAEIDRFIDTPVKHYSSGMYVRLAFAVAAHLQPEILLVDEVLAVGDIGFQRKCIGRMEDVSQAGRTILFVSHNMAMIEALCPRAILLKDGMQTIEGPTETVIAAYMNELQVYRNTNLRDRVDRKGTGEIRFTEVMILDGDGNQVTQYSSGKNCLLSMHYEAEDKTSFSGVTFGASFYNRGAHLFSVSSHLTGQDYNDLPPAGKIICHIPRLPLAPGAYQFNMICRVRGVIADWIVDAGELVVSEGDFYGTGQLPPSTHPGVLLEHKWSVEPL